MRTISAIVSYRHSGDFNGIGTDDLCNAGAMLFQMSDEATQLGAGQFVGLMCSCERTQLIIINFEI